MVTSIHPKILPASKLSGRWLDQQETIHKQYTYIT